MSRPNLSDLQKQSPDIVPESCKRILQSAQKVDSVWIGPDQSVQLSEEEREAYEAAHTIIRHMAIEMPRAHSSGHPGGPLSAFTPAYFATAMRDPAVDQPLRMSPGHLSILGFTLQYLFGRDGNDERLSSPEKLIETFRTPSGLPGHIEAGIGDIPFGTGPLGKGVSNAMGVAFGLKMQQQEGLVDVLLADGDAQEGQVMEAFRLASTLQLDNLIVHGDWNDVQLSEIASGVFASDFSALAVAAGWQVIEVQNGNDPAQVKAAMEAANEFVGKGRPIFICYYTTMGHGIPLMEKGSDTGEKIFHGAPLNDEEAGEALASTPNLADAIKTYESHRAVQKKRYEAEHVQTDIEVSFDVSSLKGYERSVTTEKGAARSDFGAKHLLNIMKADERIFVLHADVGGSGGFGAVEKVFPERCINVGVAEANMFMMACGMRQTGLLPVTYTFAAFGTNEARANARLIDINCGHTRCGIINDCTHAGISVGEDGETHQERHYLDIPFDNTEVWMPADSNQAAAMAEKSLEIIAEGHKSVFVFSARSGHPQLLTSSGKPVFDSDYVFDHKATIVHGSGDIVDMLTIVTVGPLVFDAIEAAKIVEEEEKVSVRVLSIGSVRPLDSAAIIQAAFETGHLVVIEDHSSETGLASHIADVIADFQLPCSLRRVGINRYFPSGPYADLKIIAGFDAESIADMVQDELRIEVCGGEDVLLTALYDLPHNIEHSRFNDSAREFAKRLSCEKGYLSNLISYWNGRACDPERLPSEEDVLRRLSLT